MWGCSGKHESSLCDVVEDPVERSSCSLGCCAFVLCMSSSYQGSYACLEIDNRSSFLGGKPATRQLHILLA